MDRTTKDFYDDVNDRKTEGSAGAPAAETGEKPEIPAKDQGVTKPWEKYIPADGPAREDRTGTENENKKPETSAPADGSSREDNKASGSSAAVGSAVPEPDGEKAADGASVTSDESSRADRPYTSRYDAYRFQTPEPSGGDGGNGGGRGPRNGGEPKDPRRHSRMRTVLMAVGLFVALVLAVAAVALGVSRTRLKDGSSGGTDSGASSGIVIGNSESSASSDNAASSSEEAAASEAGTDSASKTESALSTAESASSDSAEPAESAASDAEKAAGDMQIGSGNASEKDLTVPEVVSKAMPSMVSITNVSEEEYENLFGQTEKYQDVSAGSGIIVGKTDKELLIATNNHVISDSDEITVTFCDDEAVEGTLKGADADNDLAIVAVASSDIPKKTQKKISIIAVGDSDSTQVGESVVAIGNALGYGQSVSSGIISALGRQVTDSDGTVRTMIQTDASINPGNSGGALLNMKGELIGINEAKLVDTSIEGVGYAIPMATAEPILEKLGSKEARTAVSADKAGYLGVTVMTVPSAATSSGYPSGVYVSGVTAGGPADKAGLKEGDVITAVDGNSVKGNEDFLKELKYYAAGETVSLSVSRLKGSSGFTKVSVDVTLGSRKEALGSDQTDSSASDAESADSSEESGRIEGNYGNLFGDDGVFGGFGN
ncbi:S1C family serine protease [Chordicoccus furentiruminis]|jgi:serine protease Do|uniref:S1C family serine protease n=1 Tax=Chordicoccus furentiruminis TaxID=2709410 RepID=UPI0023A87D54|nr:trypsin-like peptidase domain-containing protein [Chordicoccus furentiruminis]